jgi:hypothetical protein
MTRKYIQELLKYCGGDFFFFMVLEMEPRPLHMLARALPLTYTLNPHGGKFSCFAAEVIHKNSQGLQNDFDFIVDSIVLLYTFFLSWLQGVQRNRYTHTVPVKILCIEGLVV